MSTFIKSCSEGELINDSDTMNVKQGQTESSRLKRTFTLPRNPFGNNRMSKHRSKQKDADSKSIINVSSEQNVLNESEKCGKKVFRRPSWKKFITKIAHHMNSVGVTAVIIFFTRHSAYLFREYVNEMVYLRRKVVNNPSRSFQYLRQN